MLNRLAMHGGAPLLALLWVLVTAPESHAQALPGPADAGRIDQRPELRAPEPMLASPAKPMRIMPAAQAPEQSRHVMITLRDVRIEGMHAFTADQVKDIYEPYLGRTVTLDTVWLIAGQLTERYHGAGYFLSRVTVPQQEVSNGVITLHAIEGYVGEVSLKDPLATNSIVAEWLARLQSYRPLKADQAESVLLQLNDLPGINLRAILEPLPTGGDEGAVRMVLERRDEPVAAGQVSLDNNGSRFLGPYQATAQVQAVVVPMEKTSATFLASLPWDELKYGSLKQEIPVIAGGAAEIYASRTNAQPGYTLKPEEIKSDSTLLGVAFNYKLIRQRQENLTGRVAFESRETDSDILGTPLTRDSIRALRAGLTYETLDPWNGDDLLATTLSQGIDAFGASKAGQLNLSRAEAKPDFTKLEASINRTQSITPEWGLVTGAAMQLASEPLYSSEEFGYGGQAFGRAFDDSEITGDHGVAATAELRYTGLDAWNGFQPVPYGFYDVGMVWNMDRDQEASASGSSAGAGVRLLSDIGFSANLGLAFPLTRDIANPLYGNGKNPRYTAQLSYGF